MRPHVVARQQALLDLVRRHRSLLVRELAAELDVHPITVRRDLEELAGQHKVERRHGRVLWPGAPVAPEPSHRGAVGVAVGMVAPVQDYYFAEVIRGAQAVAMEQGVRITLELTGYDAARDVAALEALLDAGTDGILFTPAGDAAEVPAGLADRLLATGTPLVTVERSLPPGHPLAVFDAVYADHAHGVGRALRHLAGTGRRKVLMMDRRSVPGSRYREGYLAGMAELGLAPPAPPMEALGPDAGSRDFAAGVGRLVRLVRSGRADAIVIQNDSSAIEVVRALLAAGVRIPRDLAVVSYDDEWAGRCEIPLTAVSPPKRLVGAEALRRLLLRVEERRRPGAGATSTPARETPRRTALVPELVLRRSTPL